MRCLLPAKEAKHFPIACACLLFTCSTRSLVVPDLTKTDVTNEATLFGGIQYEMDTTAVQQDTMRKNTPASATGGLSFAYADRSTPQRGENWNYLPGIEKEVSAIRPLLKKSKFSA